MNENLKPEQTIKVFVLTPHQNYSSNYKRCWESDCEAIQRKFKDKGCGEVDRNWEGVVCSTKQDGFMLQGSSNNLVRCFLDNDGDIGREHVIEPVISDKSIKIQLWWTDERVALMNDHIWFRLTNFKFICFPSKVKLSVINCLLILQIMNFLVLNLITFGHRIFISGATNPRCVTFALCFIQKTEIMVHIN